MSNAYGGPDQYIPSGGSFGPSPPAAPEPWSPVSSRMLRWIVVTVAIGLVLGPIAFRGIPKEVARWHVGAGLEHAREDRSDDAFASADKALAWDPQCVEAYLLRSQIHEQRDDADAALRDCNRALELLTDRPEAQARVQQLRTQLLLALERFDEAIAISETRLKSLERAPRSQRSAALNELAYFRALADRDAEQGLREVQEALEIERDNPAMLDTRGYLYFRLKKYDEALRDLDAAVEATERDFEKLVGVQADQLRGVDPSDLKELVGQAKRNLAVIRYHRAQLHQARDDAAKADVDLARVRELGFEPSSKLF